MPLGASPGQVKFQVMGIQCLDHLAETFEQILVVSEPPQVAPALSDVVQIGDRRDQGIEPVGDHGHLVLVRRLLRNAGHKVQDGRTTGETSQPQDRPLSLPVPAGSSLQLNVKGIE